MGVTFHSLEVGKCFKFGVSQFTAAALLNTLGYQDKVAELTLEGSGVLDPVDLLPRIAQARADFADVMFVGDWSRGRIIAVHTKPEGGSYTGDSEVCLLVVSA